MSKLGISATIPLCLSPSFLHLFRLYHTRVYLFLFFFLLLLFRIRLSSVHIAVVSSFHPVDPSIIPLNMCVVINLFSSYNYSLVTSYNYVYRRRNSFSMGFYTLIAGFWILLTRVCHFVHNFTPRDKLYWGITDFFFFFFSNFAHEYTVIV